MKEFFIEDDKIRLHAKLDMPKGQEPRPLVILVHGLTGDMEERHIVAVQQAMNAAGYAVLRAEMYGHGLSEGKFEDHTIFKWISNVFCVTDYAKTLPFVTDLYLCGHSQGGLLTILAAGMRPNDYKAIIPMSPALNIPDGARSGNILGLPFDPEQIPDMCRFKEYPLKGDYLRCAQLIHAEDAIKRYNRPVLIVHGDMDDAVPVRYAQEAAFRYTDCELALIPGDTHCYDYHLETVCAAIRSFLIRQL